MANPTDYQLGPNNTSLFLPQVGKWLVPSDGDGGNPFAMPSGNGVYRAGVDWNAGTPWKNTELLNLPFFGQIAGGQLYDQMPGAQYAESAPDEGFMGSFKYVAPFILGGAMPFMFPGAAGAAGLSEAGGTGAFDAGIFAPGDVGLGGGAGFAGMDPATLGDLSIGRDMANYGALDPASFNDFNIGADMRGAALDTPGGQSWLDNLYRRNYYGPGVQLPSNPSGNNAPVEDRTRVYDPTSQTFTPNLGNLASGAAKIAGLPGTGGASGMDPRLKNIKDALSISSAVGSLLSGLNLPSQGDLAGLSRATDAGRRAVVNSNLKQIEDSFGQFNDDYFNRIADAFKNYYQPQVKDTFDLATKKTIYAAPGGVGSTAFADQIGRVEKDRQLAETAVGEQSADEAARAKAAIEGTKSNLIGLASSSEDPGAFGAQAAAAAKASAQTPTYNPLADLFSRYANLAANAAVASKQGYGSTGTTPTSFGGYGGTGSKGSVSTVWR